MKKIFSLLLIFPLFAAFLPLEVFSLKTDAPQVYASGCILMEKDDRHIIYAENENKRLSPASTTKIMTALVALERADLNEEVVISSNADATEGSSAYLRAGERLTVEELLYCLLLQSANDAATALAEHISGSIEDFAHLMNEKAEELALENTHFTNPHGLFDEAHYTTAQDLALLACSALDNPVFAQIVSTKTVQIGQNENARRFTNHNRLLFTLEGCIGVKTGYTIASGRCLVSACKRGDTTLICVTLDCHDDWAAHTSLYEYGFSRVKRCAQEKTTSSLPLVGFAERHAQILLPDYSFLTQADADIRVEILAPHYLMAPLKKGEKIGEMTVYLDGKETLCLPIVSDEDIEALDPPGFFKRILQKLFSLFQKDGN